MANPIYIKEVLTLLNKQYNLILNNSGSNNVFITHQNKKKTLPFEITKNGNFLENILFLLLLNFLLSLYLFNIFSFYN